MGGVRICAGCGIIAPSMRTSCSVCNAPFSPQPLVAAGRVGSAVLACVHAADFTCKACGIRSPLATLDCEGQAECMGCGLRQAFDVVQWTDALGFAHGVADLSGHVGDPLAARSRHAKIGSEFTSSTKTQNAMIMDGGGTRTHSLRTTVSPGHPVCKTCHVPLDVWLEGATAKTRCPRCNDTAAYGLPAGVERAYAAVRGVLANEQRTDRPIAKLGRTQAGAESIMCPQCGSPMQAGSGSELEKCSYCGLAVRIPGTLARQQRRGAVPKMEPFWILFDGPSPGRQRLARGKREDPDDDDDDDDDVAPHPPAGGFGAAPPMAGAYGYGAPRMAPPPKKSGALVIVLVVVGLLVLLVVGGAVAGAVFWMGAEEAPPPRTTPAAPKKPAKR